MWLFYHTPHRVHTHDCFITPLTGYIHVTVLSHPPQGTYTWLFYHTPPHGTYMWLFYHPLPQGTYTWLFYHTPHRVHTCDCFITHPTGYTHVTVSSHPPQGTYMWLLYHNPHRVHTCDCFIYPVNMFSLTWNVLPSVTLTPWSGSTFQPLNSAWGINGQVVTTGAALLQIRERCWIWNNKLNNNTFFIR